jgi:hypothetical protein
VQLATLQRTMGRMHRATCSKQACGLQHALPCVRSAARIDPSCSSADRPSPQHRTRWLRPAGTPSCRRAAFLRRGWRRRLQPVLETQRRTRRRKTVPRVPLRRDVSASVSCAVPAQCHAGPAPCVARRKGRPRKVRLGLAAVQREDDPFYKLEHDTGNIAKAKASAPSIACVPARAGARRCNGLPRLPRPAPAPELRPHLHRNAPTSAPGPAMAVSRMQAVMRGAQSCSMRSSCSARRFHIQSSVPSTLAAQLPPNSPPNPTFTLADYRGLPSPARDGRSVVAFPSERRLSPSQPPVARGFASRYSWLAACEPMHRHSRSARRRACSAAPILQYSGAVLHLGRPCIFEEVQVAPTPCIRP